MGKVYTKKDIVEDVIRRVAEILKESAAHKGKSVVSDVRKVKIKKK